MSETRFVQDVYHLAQSETLLNGNVTAHMRYEILTLADAERIDVERRSRCMSWNEVISYAHSSMAVDHPEIKLNAFQDMVRKNCEGRVSKDYYWMTAKLLYYIALAREAFGDRPCIWNNIYQILSEGLYVSGYKGCLVKEELPDPYLKDLPLYVTLPDQKGMNKDAYYRSLAEGETASGVPNPLFKKVPKELLE